MQNEIRYFSMFSGVGGFELGLERANDLSKTSWNKSRRDEENSSSVESELLASKQFVSRERSESKICNGNGKCEKRDGGTETSIKSIQECGESSQRQGNTTSTNGGQKKFYCIGMSEIDKYSSQVLKDRFPNIKNYGDATKINPRELPDFDMLCGGFPCQAFSIAGKRKGFEDIRGTMFFEIARILKVKRPKIILLENVKGLLNHNKGETFRVILQTLDELGYEVQWMVLNSKFFGVPQNRERVFIIGSLRGERRPEILPFKCSNQIINEQDAQRNDIAHCLQCGEKHRGSYIKQLNSPTHSNNRLYSEDGISPALNTAQGGNRQPKIRAVLTPDRPEKRQNGRRFKEEGEPSFTITGQDIHGVAIRWPLRFQSRNQKNIEGDYAYTVDSSNTGGIREGIKIRRLTPVECCRLQGFPDDWNDKMSDSQRYKQLGNAVTTNVIKAIGGRLLASQTD